MPSPTSSTSPTSRESVVRPHFLISSSITEAISPGLNLMTAPLDQLVPDHFQAGADAGVVHPVPHAHPQPAQQVRVDPGLEDRLAPVGLTQLLPQALLLVLVQGHRRAHQDLHPAAALLVQLAVGGGRCPQDVEALVLVEDQQEVERGVADPALEGLAEDLALAVT